MPGWGLPRSGFRWIAGANIPTLPTPASLGDDHSRCSLSPFLPRANSFVHPPPRGKPVLRRAWRLDSCHHRRFRYPGPTVCESLLLRPGRADPAGCADQPLDVAALPEPGCLLGQRQLQPAERSPQERTLAAGIRLQAQREAAGFGEAAVRGSGSLHRLKKPKAKPTPSK